jgi:Xaa-Pro dipeptidase
MTSSISRRSVLFAGVGAISTIHADAVRIPASIGKLRKMTDGIQPITQAERAARLEKARKLMHENGLRAIVCEGGSSMFYFTSVRWDPIGFPLVLILPAEGKPAWVADRQQAARLHGLLAPGSELRTWSADSARGKTVAQTLADLSAGLGPIGMEDEPASWSSTQYARRLPKQR